VLGVYFIKKPFYISTTYNSIFSRSKCEDIILHQMIHRPYDCQNSFHFTPTNVSNLAPSKRICEALSHCVITARK